MKNLMDFEENSEKNKELEQKAVELSYTLKSISDCVKSGDDDSKLQIRRKRLLNEVQQLRKELGYKCRDDFEREL